MLGVPVEERLALEALGKVEPNLENKMSDGVHLFLANQMTK